MMWPGLHIAARFVTYWARFAFNRPLTPMWRAVPWLISSSTAIMLAANVRPPENVLSRVGAPDGVREALVVQHLADEAPWRYSKVVYVHAGPHLFMPGSRHVAVVFREGAANVEVMWDGPQRLRVVGGPEVLCAESSVTGVQVILVHQQDGYPRCVPLTQDGKGR